jgi:hypothetical protein
LGLQRQVGKAQFLTFLLTQPKADGKALGLAAYFVSEALEGLDSTGAKEVRDQLAILPITRRVAYLEALAELGPPDIVFELTTETLTNPEERSALPERLRSLYSSSKAGQESHLGRRAKSTRKRVRENA